MTTLDVVISFATGFIYFLINPFRVYMSIMAIFYRRPYDLMYVYKIEPADRLAWKFQSVSYKLHKKSIIDAKNRLMFISLATYLSELIAVILLAIVTLFKGFDEDLRIAGIYTFISMRFLLFGFNLYIHCNENGAWHWRIFKKYPKICLWISFSLSIYELYTGFTVSSLWFVWLYFKDCEHIVMWIENFS